MRKIEMVGMKFGRLLVISEAKPHHNRRQWNCQCDCGNLCIASGKFMRQGKKRSCGCLKRESAQEKMRAMVLGNTLPPGEAAFNLLYATYRCSADKRGFDFLLTKEDFKALTKSDCFYCGKVPIQTCKPDLQGGYVYNGIDRRDNALGYTIENSVACCKLCNWMKNQFDENVFLQHCELIVSHQNHKKQAEMTCSE